MSYLKLTILLFIFLFNISFLKGQEQLKAIDNLYVSSISHFYKDAEIAKNDIWEEMKLAPVCLFRINGPALLYNHPSPPDSFRKISDNLYVGTQKEWQLFGATQIEINGVLTAIVDYGLNHYSCPEEVYAELFHELHHVYQRTFIKQIKYDNPAHLLTYPENSTNDGLKLLEQKLLYKLCFERDSISFQRLVNQFYSLRKEREKIIGGYLDYEKTVENMEGPAFYCEYKFYNQFASVGEELKENYNEKHFFGVLSTPFFGRKSLRRRHLAAGMAMCFILNNHFDNWQKEYYSGDVSLYDFFISKFHPQVVELDVDPMYYSISEFHTSQEIQEHQNNFNNFSTQAGVKITLRFNTYPQFRGFDPMHAESINDSTVLHHTLLKLSGGEDNELFITNNKAVTLIGKEIWFVKNLILFADQNNIHVGNNSIKINVEGINVFWSGTLTMKTEKEIIFNCN